MITASLFIQLMGRRRVALLLMAGMFLLGCSGKKTDDPAPAATCNGTVSGRCDGVTFTRTDGVNAVLVNNQYMGLTNDAYDVKIGDSEALATTPGASKANCFGAFTTTSGHYSTRKITITITGYDGTTLQGSFTGQAKKDGSTVYVPVSGTFQTTCLTKL